MLKDQELYKFWKIAHHLVIKTNKYGNDMAKIFEYFLVYFFEEIQRYKFFFCYFFKKKGGGVHLSIVSPKK